MCPAFRWSAGGYRPARILFISIYTPRRDHGHAPDFAERRYSAYHRDARKCQGLHVISPRTRSRLPPSRRPAAGLPSPARQAAQLQATKIGFHPLKLVNGWLSSQSRFDTGNPAYGTRDGIVYLAGSIHRAKAGGTEFAVLPPGDRPAHNLYIMIYTFLATTGTLQVKPNGELLAFSSTNTTAQDYTSLAGISFRSTPSGGATGGRRRPAAVGGGRRRRAGGLDRRRWRGRLAVSCGQPATSARADPPGRWPNGILRNGDSEGLSRPRR
jgi:hypothetical protein